MTRALLVFDHRRADHEAPVAARHDIDGMTRMQQPHRPLEAKSRLVLSTSISPFTPRKSGSASRAANPRQSIVQSGRFAHAFGGGIEAKAHILEFSEPRGEQDVSARADRDAPRAERKAPDRNGRQDPARDRQGRLHPAIRSRTCMRENRMRSGRSRAGASTSVPLTSAAGTTFVQSLCPRAPIRERAARRLLLRTRARACRLRETNSRGPGPRRAR